MDFIKVIDEVIPKLDKAGIRYALIGGFAMALRGVQRATIDLDFILMLEDLDKVDTLFRECGYECDFRSENVSHYTCRQREFGRIDLLHAFRGPSLSMLGRADRIQLADDLSLPVVQIEDLIGLKVQAAHNDSSRAISDWLDIQLLLETASRNERSIDWDLLLDYLELFNESEKLEQMKMWYGPAD